MPLGPRHHQARSHLTVAGFNDTMHSKILWKLRHGVVPTSREPSPVTIPQRPFRASGIFDVVAEGRLDLGSRQAALRPLACLLEVPMGTMPLVLFGAAAAIWPGAIRSWSCPRRRGSNIPRAGSCRGPRSTTGGPCGRR